RRSCAAWGGRGFAKAPPPPLTTPAGVLSPQKQPAADPKETPPRDTGAIILPPNGPPRPGGPARYDERPPPPIGAPPPRINRGEVTREPCRVVTRERVAVALVQVAVVVAEIEREHALGDGETDIPGGIAAIRNAVGIRRGTARNGAGLGAVEVIARAQE